MKVTKMLDILQEHKSKAGFNPYRIGYRR